LKAYRDALQAKEEAFEKENNISFRSPVSETAPKQETIDSNDAILIQTAKALIKVAMEAKTKEDCYKCLALALLEGAREGKVGSFGFLLYALYQHYNTTNDPRAEECYNIALNLLTVNLNSSDNINFLKTIKPFLTPSISVISFFELITAELALQKDGTSPFKNLELKEFIDIFIRGFKKDPELSTNNTLIQIVNFYVEILRDEYNISAAFIGSGIL
jgi:hypothetical protein